jgi:hypothetical protein
VKPLDHLVGVIHAVDAMRLALGLGQSGQQQASQNGNDSDHHKQLNKSESGGSTIFFHNKPFRQ